MTPEMQAQLTGTATATGPNGTRGLAIPRRYTTEGQSPFDMIKYELRSSVIRNSDGTTVFKMENVEVPATWSQVATDILAQKYFRKAGVPYKNEDGTPQLNTDGSPVLGPETSVKQVVHRLAGCWRWWGEQYGYFSSPRDAQAFYDEIAYMLLTQVAAPNSPQWFNTGLNWAYGITGPAQGHYYVDPETKTMTRSKDAYSHPQPHACVAGDTLVITDSGTMTIREIVENNRTDVKVFDGAEWAQVLAVKNNGIRQVYRMTLANGQYVDLTDDHLVLTSREREKDGGWYDWAPAQTALGKKVLYTTKHKNSSLVFEKQKELVSANTAELVGFHVGDGYARTYGKTAHFGVAAATQDEFDRMSTLFTDVFGAFTVTKKPQISDSYCVVRHDFVETEKFRTEYELGVGSCNVGVPKKIFAAEPEAQRAFLRGLFQADGAVRLRTEDGRNSGDVCLATISQKLAHEVQTLLGGLGIYARISECHDQRENHSTLFHVIVAYESERIKFAEQIGFVSGDKKEKLERLNTEVRGKSKKSISEETVAAFEYRGEEEVFDIQTTTEKFSANGVVVHNCFIQSVVDDLVNDGGIMDLWLREARIFKYGSGTGTNFSTLRGKGEKLSGGGSSSGLMSWLRIGDRAAGAIKSGGTTRRAAKMVILDVDHPDIEEFITWKMSEEKKVAALVAGGFPSDYEGEAYQTVSGQNSNNSVRVSNAFVQAVLEDRDWYLRWRTDGRICKTLKATELWDKTATAAWSCADPGIQFDTTINDWHTCPKSGRINGSNPCSEYMFLDNTACNLASLNLAKFFDPKTMVFDVDSFRHASRLWTMVLEISVLMAQFPSEEIAQMSYDFRTLGLGYANLGAGVLMVAGIPYDSPEARAIAGALSSIMTGESYATSAEMAKHQGPFVNFDLNRSDMLRVVRNHRRAAYNAPADEYEKLAVKPVGINPQFCPVYLLKAARAAWDRALELGEIYGYRNAQTTLLAPTGTIGLLMDCATTGVEPDFALVKFKKLAGGGYFKIVNESVPVALKTLNYKESEIDDIIRYVRGSGTLIGAPQINHTTLKAKGLNEDDLKKIESQLPSVFEIQFAFNVWALGEETLQRLGFTAAQYNNLDFNMLRALGFTNEQIQEANEYVCGTMTIEGAPFLKKEHYPVFDCANRCGKKGERFIQHMGHIRMMAAVQPFLSGAISKTINMPNEVTVDDVKESYVESWRLGIKAMALYRDGCKLSQPLATKGDTKEEKKDKTPVEVVASAVNLPQGQDDTFVAPALEATPAPVLPTEVVTPVLSSAPEEKAMGAFDDIAREAQQLAAAHGTRRQLPAKRAGMTVEAKIGNQQVYLRTGEYADGALGEIFIDMYREGAAFRSMLNLFAISVSLGLQYGVPLEKFVEKFTFTRFEPSGFTTHPNVKMCTSIIDYVFRVLAVEYLGRNDLAQVPPEPSDRLQAPTAVKPAIGPTEAATQIGEQTAIFAGSQPAVQKSAHNAALSELMGDAPPCDTCGHTTVRNGSCYRCLNCGASMGCS